MYLCILLAIPFTSKFCLWGWKTGSFWWKDALKRHVDIMSEYKLYRVLDISLMNNTCY